MELPSNGARLSDAYASIVKGILDTYIQGFPRVNAHLRVGLRYLHDGAFTEYLEQYMRPLLIKGVPSVMQDLREFYNTPSKYEIIGRFLTDSITSMESDMTLRPGDEDEQDPTVQLWLYYYMAQHHMFLGELSEALAFVNKAIEHTPTLLELYTLKGILY